MGYTRHDSSCLGIAYVQPTESQSLFMLIDGLQAIRIIMDIWLL